MSRLLSPGLQKYRVKFFDIRRVAARVLQACWEWVAMGQECANLTKERKAALYFDDIDALGAENTHHLQASSIGGHLNMPAYHPCDMGSSAVAPLSNCNHRCNISTLKITGYHWSCLCCVCGQVASLNEVLLMFGFCTKVTTLATEL